MKQHFSVAEYCDYAQSDGLICNISPVRSYHSYSSQILLTARYMEALIF
jgi:hypothetical protein